MKEESPPRAAPRPYFLPPEIELETLPEAVQIAIQSIIEPAYAELVLAAPNPLERSMGISFVFLLTEEVLSHFELGRQMNLDQTQGDEERARRERDLARYLKLFGAKTSALHALLRLRKLPPLARFSSAMP